MARPKVSDVEIAVRARAIKTDIEQARNGAAQFATVLIKRDMLELTEHQGQNCFRRPSAARSSFTGVDVQTPLANEELHA